MSGDLTPQQLRQLVVCSLTVGSFESASETERRERLELWVGNKSLTPNGTLDGFNHVLYFD